MLTLLSTLMKTSQEDITRAEYMQNINTSDAEIVSHTLNGLSNEYKDLNTAIRTRETAMTFEELHDKLLDHETFLKHEEGKKTAPLITAQYNQHRPNNKNRPRNGHTNNGI
ncbi:unnamed protein product [Fraxinus pennsylvanica]|uniref:Uncharacterized protein n=1 Tax=Fraxinus pennsylvanica TaxID=56036 RepID=A0AAD2DKZ3_9LAMI|nr:unnamed protein product [Fraxinus pennsylvanica]